MRLKKTKLVIYIKVFKTSDVLFHGLSDWVLKGINYSFIKRINCLLFFCFTYLDLEVMVGTQESESPLSLTVLRLFQRVCSETTPNTNSRSLYRILVLKRPTEGFPSRNTTKFFLLYFFVLHTLTVVSTSDLTSHTSTSLFSTIIHVMY